MSVRIVVGDALGDAPFPDTQHGRYARAWLMPLARQGTHKYLRNVRCEVGAVFASSHTLPLTLHTGSVVDNAYVASLHTHYIRYLEEELRLVTSSALRGALARMLRVLGALLSRERLDRTVIVNNWLLSTNLYPAGIAPWLPQVADAVRARFPDHAILFRSLNHVTTPDALHALRGAGFTPLVSRQVYLFDACDEALFRKKTLRRDLLLAGRSGYRIVPIASPSPAMTARVVALYEALYLRKYSRHNPAFSSAFVELAARSDLLQLEGVFQGDRLDGVLGCFERDGVMTTPLLGYDTDLPAGTGLYRMLTARLSQIARERRLLLHRSSGAATFKRARGAEPALEYAMLDARHLSRERRARYALLGAIVEGLGKPLLARYDR